MLSPAAAPSGPFSRRLPMTLASHRTRFAVIALLLASLGLLLTSRPAHGGWSADPVQVHATTSLCPLVSASDDANYGAIIVWQENSATGGVLKARHLLATGDVDAAWAAPVTVSTADMARSALGSVADGEGGAYVWWMEGAQLYLTRVAADGTIGGGWPARGRLLGSLLDPNSRPHGVPDGSGGIYLGWLAPMNLMSAEAVVRAAHLGPDNIGKGGWGNGSRTLGSTQEFGEVVSAFGIDVASDGGLWLAFATTTVVELQVYAAGDVRLARLTAGGMPETGWDAHGVSVAPFRGDLLATSPDWDLAPHMSLAAIAHDGGTGTYLVYSQITGEEPNAIALSYRLARLNQAGAPAAGWPADGQPLSPGGATSYGDPGATYSLRALADESGGVQAGLPAFFTHGTMYELRRVSGTGTTLASTFAGDTRALEYVARTDGGLYLASFWPNGPLGMYQPNAYIRAEQSSPGQGFLEWHTEPSTWYGDVGLSSTGDGGAIFAWSQVQERFGVFAVRLNPSGVVTGVPPSTASRGVRMWFTRGVGVQLATGGGTSVTLRLHDVTGREGARGEWGGDGLAPGGKRGTAG